MSLDDDDDVGDVDGDDDVGDVGNDDFLFRGGFYIAVAVRRLRSS